MYAYTYIHIHTHTHTHTHTHIYIYIYIYIYTYIYTPNTQQLNIAPYPQMPKNRTQQQDTQNTAIFRLLQILYGLTMKRKV